jgi:hypothetical protein
VDSDSQISLTSPVSTGTGLVDITVVTPADTTPVTTKDQFTYTGPTVADVAPNTGPQSGGTPVTITGTGFSGTPTVMFGANPATVIQVTGTQITVTSPASTITGPVAVTVTTPAGTSAVNSSSQFTYDPLPVISNVSPGRGPAAGGNPVTITGTGFTSAPIVMFGANPATVIQVTGTQITVTSPASTVTGLVAVTVTTPGGTSNPNSNARYGYLS